MEVEIVGLHFHLTLGEDKTWTPPREVSRVRPQKGAKPKKHTDIKRHKYLKYVTSSSEYSEFHPQVLKSSTGEQPVRSKSESQEANKPMTFGDLKEKDLTEPIS